MKTMINVLWAGLVLSKMLTPQRASGDTPAVSTGPAKEEQVVAYDFVDKEIYRSPQTPSWAAWISLCKMRSGDALLSITQLTGNTQRAQSYNMEGVKKETILLRTKDGGKTWDQTAAIASPPEPGKGWIFSGAGFATLLELPDGSLLGSRYGRDWGTWGPKDGLIFRSTDGGKTWSEPQRFNDLEETSAAPSRMLQLRDGTLMLAYQGGKAGYPDSGRYQHAGVYLSHDQGKTWEGPDIIAPADDGFMAYPEPAFVEFPDRELFFIFRIETFPDPKDDKYISTLRRQCLVRKKRGHYVAGPITETMLPHAGHPELLLTNEGVLLYLCENGYWWSLDKGKNWHKMDIPPSYYYPQAIQLDDGRVMVVGHVGGDDPFPPPREMTIHCQWFRIRKESK